MQYGTYILFREKLGKYYVGYTAFVLEKRLKFIQADKLFADEKAFD